MAEVGNLKLSTSLYLAFEVDALNWLLYFCVKVQYYITHFLVLFVSKFQDD